jgi:hemerythrin
MIEWNDSLLIGEEIIDKQHKKLFSIINEFLEAKTKTEQQHCCRNMYDYIKYHFNYEEKVMRDVKYPEYVRHLTLHHNLIFALNKVSISISDGTLDKEKLEKFVNSWLIQHIPIEDIKLSKHISDSKSDD